MAKLRQESSRRTPKTSFVSLALIEYLDLSESPCCRRKSIWSLGLN